MTDDNGEKLVPDTVTSEPGGPVAGLRPIPTTRVKLEKPEFDDASVAPMVWLPASPAGAVKAAVKPPVLLVVDEPKDVASNVIVTDAAAA